MESKEDSIKVLEMRIRHQMSDSVQKNIKPENIKYYMPSAGLPKADTQQASHPEDAGTGNPSADAAEPGSPAAGPGEQAGQSHGGPGSASAADKAETELSAAGDPYIDLESITRAIGAPPMMEYEPLEIPESKQIQHARAMSGYERSRSLDRKGIFDMGEKHFLDFKG